MELTEAPGNAQEVAQLVSLLSVAQIETQVFCGESHDLGFAQLFGGLVLGQALMAAAKAAQTDRIVHSFHGYFLRAGNSKDPIYYEVDLIRTGKSFSTRRVLAKQNGLAIFMGQYSFHKLEEGLDFAPKMPQVTPPEKLESEAQIMQRHSGLLPPRMLEKILAFNPVDVRVVDPIDPKDPKPRPPIKNLWTKIKGAIPDDPLLSQAMLAYVSDFGLATTSLIPHGLTFLSKDVQVSSLDHTMWFHRNFKYSGWFLHALESVNSYGNRGLNRGLLYSPEGKLVASMAQEGLMRTTRPSNFGPA